MIQGSSSYSLPRRPGRPAGFTLVEMMLALMFTVVVGALFTQIFRSVWLLNNHAERTANAVSRFDGALGVMRSDVWNACAIDTPDARTLRITEGDGRSITWKIAPDHSLCRQGNAGSAQIWKKLGAGVSLARRGAAVILDAPGDNASGQLHSRMQWCLASQILLENSGHARDHESEAKP